MLCNQFIISTILCLGYTGLVMSAGIDVPLGNILIKNLHGVGTQDYKCTNGKFLVFDESAVLNDPDNRQDKQGTYNLNRKGNIQTGNAEFEVKGSKATFKVIGQDISVVVTNTPDLLYKIASTGIIGTLANCTYVQRRNTFGGVPPSRICREGEMIKVAYQADYAFFAKGQKGSETPGGSPSNDFINIPDNFNGAKVPENNKRLMRLHGIGVQIYRCKKGTYELSNVQADLYQPNDQSIILGRHFFNTNLDENGGKAAFVVNDSTAVFKKIAERKSSNPKNIPELLLVRTSSTPGALGESTFLKRLKTIGGVAPAGTCAAGSPDARVPYEADYVFYTAKASK